MQQTPTSQTTYVYSVSPVLPEGGYELSPTAASAIAYYDAGAPSYVEASKHRQVSPPAQWLAKEFGPGMLVVDAGCGDGVDSEFLLKSGMRVYSYDASERMVELSTSRLAPLNQQVHLCRHDQLRLPERADAILALASLLFLPEKDLDVALKNLASNLLPGGLLICSFKAGTQVRDAGDGRIFHDYSEADLPKLARMAQLEPQDVWRSADLAGRGNEWVTFVLRKP